MRRFNQHLQQATELFSVILIRAISLRGDRGYFEFSSAEGERILTLVMGNLTLNKQTPFPPSISRAGFSGSRVSALGMNQKDLSWESSA